MTLLIGIAAITYLRLRQNRIGRIIVVVDGVRIAIGIVRIHGCVVVDGVLTILIRRGYGGLMHVVDLTLGQSVLAIFFAVVVVLAAAVA